MKKISIGLVNRNTLFAEALKTMLSRSSQIEVITHTTSGWLMKHELEEKPIRPEIIIVATNTQVLTALETTIWIRQHYPMIKLIALALGQDDTELRAMLKAGCCAFLYLLSEPDAFVKAITEVHDKGFYNLEAESPPFSFFRSKTRTPKPLPERGQEFLELICSNMTADEIRMKLNLTWWQFNHNMTQLYNRFHVTGRNGVVLEAVRQNCVVTECV